MADLDEMFPGFQARTVATEAGRIFVQIGGAGPPLMLLHGFPQTRVMWHRIAPALARRFTVVVMDLRGYGWSSAPESRGGEAYSKRAMGRDVVAVMDALGFATFALAGHDRGARVGYRLALDAPGRITRLALLDIVPTLEVWRGIERGSGGAPHWPFLAGTEPGPERAIAAGTDDYFESLMRGWTLSKSLDAFDPGALAHYRAGWNEPSRIHAMCEDYRAGAILDRRADEADEAASRTIGCPTFILAATDYLPGSGDDAPLAIWRRTFAPEAEGARVDSGHFLAEENPGETTRALLGFM